MTAPPIPAGRCQHTAHRRDGRPWWRCPYPTVPGSAHCAEHLIDHVHQQPERNTR